MDQIVTKNNDKALAHGCLMIFAWLYLVPTAIILARYFRNLFPSFNILNVPFWLNAHRFLMVFTLILSFIALFLILANEHWKWVEADKRVNFTHSIFGIVVIGILFFQITLGIIRPKKTSKFRNIFNWFHRSVGIVCFILAIVTCYLSVNIQSLKLKNIGWGLMLGWSLSLIIFIVLIEICERRFSTRDSYMRPGDKSETLQNEKPLVYYVKIWLLVLHLIASLAFVVALMTMVGLSKKNISE